MDKEISLLWVNLNLSKSNPLASSAFSEFFSIRRPDTQELKSKCFNKNSQPNAFVFEFDFPDKKGLHLLSKTKKQFPSLPIIMVTEQHSEELAVWALRARVWEYIIKPADQNQLEELQYDLLRLQQIQQSTDTHRSLFQREHRIPNESRLNPESPSNEIIQRAIYYIDAHLSEKITEEKVAALCGMSPYRFSRLFKEACSSTFQEYLVQHRIDEAVRLLANPKTLITDIAYTVGFNDASYFTRAFKRYIGVSPSDYRSRQLQYTSADYALSKHVEM